MGEWIGSAFRVLSSEFWVHEHPKKIEMIMSKKSTNPVVSNVSIDKIYLRICVIL